MKTLKTSICKGVTSHYASKRKASLLTFLLLFISALIRPWAANSQGLEGIVVEKYYVSNSADSANASTALSGAGYSTGTLPSGSVTWRIYADLAPGWGVQAVFGESTHPLRLTTSTQFFNHPNGNVGPLASNGLLSQGTTILDSYVACGGVTNTGRFGVLKSEDSPAGGTNLTFGAGILTNADPSASPAPATTDGVYNTSFNPALIGVTSLGDISAAAGQLFGDGSVVGSSFISTNSSWGVLGEQVGAFPAGSNRVLIGQFTTNGEFRYELNIQIRNTTTAQVLKYVSSNPQSGEILFSALNGLLNPQSPFTPGNLVVYQVGDGSAALSNVGTAVFLREFSTTTPGTAINSVAMPASARLSASGTATSEGFLSRSTDSLTLVLPGYDAALGTASVATASGINRVINQVNLCGNVSRAASSGSLLTGNNFRSAVKNNQDNYWGGGGVGAAYFGTLSPASNLAGGNIRVLGIFNGELYFTSGAAATLGLNKFSGLPTGTSTFTNVFSTGTGSSPYGFAINAAGTVAYIADDRTAVGSGGIQKWTFNGSSWTLAYTLSTVTGTSNSGARGLVVDFSGANPVLYATTVEGSANRLVRITDTGAGATATLLSTAPTNTVFRGVTFAPKPCAPAALTASVTNATCNGSSNGSINLTATTCSFPTSYQWSNGATTEDLTGLAAGTYTVTVTASGGCTSTASFTVTQPAPVNATASNNGPVCSGFALNLSATGGVSYSWTGPNGFSSSLQNPVINPASAADSGLYTVIVTNASGCTGTATTVASVSVCTCIPPTLSASTTQPLCNGASNGSINLTVSGGVSPYTYLWSNGATTEDVNGLTAGVYSVIVTDAVSCVDTLDITLSEPAVLFLSGSVQNPGCPGFSNGSIDLNVNGGTPGYTFSWSNGALTEDISGLAAGTYSVTVTDLNSCSASISFTVTDPGAFTLTVDNAINPTCNGLNNGIINITASNDSLNPTNPGILISEFLPNPPGTDSSKEYVELIATKFIDFSLTPYTVIFSNNGNGTTKGWVQGGVASATTNGTYAFEISSGVVIPGEVFYVGGTQMAVTGRKLRVKDVSTQPGDGGIGSATTGGILGNGGGNADGIAVFSAPVAFIDSNSVPVDAIFFGTGAGGTVVSGGTAGFKLPVNDRYNGGFLQPTSYVAPDPGANLLRATGAYNRSNGVYSVRNWATATSVSADSSAILLSSNNSYLWSTGATTEDIGNLGSGTYTVTATSASGCVASLSVTLNAPSALSLSSSISDVSCFNGNDGQIDITVNGGVSPFSYLWSNTSVSEDQTGLNSGTYTVTVTDANGCTVADSYTVNQPADFTFSTSVTNASCAGASDGAIDLTISGGTAPYTYSWSSGDTTQDISNQPASVYFYNITDANGCQTGGLEFINEPAPILISGFTPNTGGSGVSVSISGSGFTGASFVEFAGVAAASFTVINDALIQAIVPAGADTGFITVGTSPSCFTASIDTFFYLPTACVPPSLNAVPAAVSCFGGSDGAIDLTISGGVSPYSILWSNGSVTEDIAGLTAGTYTVYVSDNTGCQDSLAVAVSQPAAINPSGVVTNISCFGLSDGSIDLSVSGGVPPYNFLWSNGSLTEDISGLAVGSYTVTVTDFNSCAATASFTVNEPALLSLTLNSTNPSCAGAADGSVTSIVTGGTSPYSYLWSTGDTSSSLGLVSAGLVILTVTDANNCTASSFVSLVDPAPFTINLDSTANVDCFGGNNGAAYISASNEGANPNNPGLLISEFLADPSGADLPFEWIELIATKPINFSVTPYTVVVANNGTATVRGWRAGGTLTYAFQISSGVVNTGDVFYVGGSSMAPTGLKLRTINTVTTAGDGFGSANGGGIGNGGANADGIAVFNLPSSVIDSSTVPVDAIMFGTGYGSAIVNAGANGYRLPNNDRYSGGLFNGTSYLAPNSASAQFHRATGGYNVLTGTYTTRTWALSTTFTDGSSAISVSGQNSYLWSNGATTQDVTGLVAGSYTVTATNSSGCAATLNVSITQPNDLTITGFSPVSGNTGDAVVISGAGFTGVDQVEFNGITASFSIDNDGQISTTVPAGASTGSIRLINNGCDTVVSGGTFTVITNAIFNLTFLFEGMHDGAGGMLPALQNSGVLGAGPTDVDTVIVELRDQLSPSTVLASGTGIVNTSGQVSFSFPGSVIGQNGYIAVFHRNAVQTWSDVITFGASNTYNFTTAASQAFGSNQIELLPGLWAFYSGDVAPQDEVVDFIDQITLDNDVFNFAFGYVTSDISGDGVSDFVDQIIMDNNVFNFVGSIHP